MPVPRAEQILALLPQIAVLGQMFLPDDGMMRVVHPHAVPHFRPVFMAAVITDLHEIRAAFDQFFTVEHQRLEAVVRLFPAQEQIAVFIQFAVLP